MKSNEEQQAEPPDAAAVSAQERAYTQVHAQNLLQQDSANMTTVDTFSNTDFLSPGQLNIGICESPWRVPEGPNWGTTVDTLSSLDLTPDESENSPPSISTMSGLRSDEVQIQPMDRVALEIGLRKDVDATPIVSAFAALTTCACLSNMYLTLDALSKMPEPFVFPFALQPLREAMQSTADIISCPVCPKRYITALQNSQSLGSLFLSIAERYAKVLDSISLEAAGAEAAHKMKKFRLADFNSGDAHVHTGGLSCAAQFSVDLSPVEWKNLAKKVVRAEIYGPTDGEHYRPYLQELFGQMRSRQIEWHNLDLPSDTPRSALLNMRDRGNAHLQADEDFPCLRYMFMAEDLVEGYDWT